MPIGPESLLKLVKEKKLVSKLDQRELKNPEGAGFDIRVGEVYAISGNAFLGRDERETPKVELLAKYNPRKKTTFVLKPGDFVLIKTIESIKLPADIAAYPT